MCAQCMITAATAAGAASGIRAWLASGPVAWLTPARLRRVTQALVVVVVLVSATLSGSGGA